MICLFTFGLAWLEAAYAYVTPVKWMALGLMWAMLLDVVWTAAWMRHCKNW